MNKLDQTIKLLAELENQLKDLEYLKEKYRSEILEELNKQDIGQYKNDIATVTFTERKTIKTERDVDDIVCELQNRKLENLLELVPAEPEHLKLGKDFERAMKSGHLIIKGVEVEVKQLPTIRFI